MRVLIPTPLQSYTGGQSEVEGEGTTLGELLRALDTRYPGLRFRVVDEQENIRPHIRFFVNRDAAAGLSAPLAPEDEVHIVCALSGG